MNAATQTPPEEEAAAEVVDVEETPIDERDVERVRNLPAVRASEAMVARDEISPSDVVAQRAKIKDVMDAVMVEGVHYGKVPGVSKPTLLKPGAEVLAVTFRLAPSYRSERSFDGPHLTVVSRATLTHIPTGLVIAEGEGLCSTRESKYAYRQGKRVCPDCNAAAIVRSGKNSAYYCISNEGGCGHRFNFGTPAAKKLDEQDVGRVENPDLPDQWNTVLKMGNKRALIAAILNGTAASDVFTQDVEDAGATAADSHERDDQQAAAGTGDWHGPKDWREFFDRLSLQLTPNDALAWMEELAEKGYAHPSIGAIVADAEFPDERKADLWNRLLAFLRTIESSGVDPAFREDVRAFVQKAIYDAFDGALALLGPQWALSPSEAEKMPPRPGDETTQEPISGEEKPASTDGPPEAASEAQAAAETVAKDGDDGTIVDGDGDAIKF